MTSAEALRSLYPQPGERPLKKQLGALDRHCQRFIEIRRWTPRRAAARRGSSRCATINDQSGIEAAAESREAMLRRYQADL
jgi:hypothetical protein